MGYLLRKPDTSWKVSCTTFDTGTATRTDIRSATRSNTRTTTGSDTGTATAWKKTLEIDQTGINRITIKTLIMESKRNPQVTSTSTTTKIIRNPNKEFTLFKDGMLRFNFTESRNWLEDQGK